LRESDYERAKDGFDIRFVTIGSQQKAEEFCGRQGMGTACIGDETRASYRAMGFEDYNLLKLFIDPALRKRRIENAAAGFSQDWSATKLADSAQLPGAAIIDANGTLRYLHTGTHPGDLPKISALLTQARTLLGSPPAP
jgi:hypothetical protein